MSSVRHASEEADESTSLLASTRNGDYNNSPTSPNDSALHNHRPEEIPQVLCPSPSKPSFRSAISPYYPHVPILIGILCFVADLGGGLTNAAEVRLLELAVCRDYYRTHDRSVIGPPPLANVDEKFCKLDEIQANLAYLRAWRGVFLMIPGKQQA